MSQKRYKLTRLIEIQHSFSGDRQKSHAHTLSVCCTVVLPEDDEIMDYSEAEAVLDKCFKRYEGQYLNNFVELNGNASVEHFGEVLCYDIDAKLKELGYDLVRFEIGETPMRIYVITDELRE